MVHCLTILTLMLLESTFMPRQSVWPFEETLLMAGASTSPPTGANSGGYAKICDLSQACALTQSFSTRVAWTDSTAIFPIVLQA